MKRSQRQVVQDRRDRKAERKAELLQRSQEKFKEERVIAPLQPKTLAQKQYIQSLKQNKISVATGHAGCGKTYCATYMAAQLLLRGEIEKIYLTRPYAHLGKDYGATPGNDFEKLEPFCRPMLDVVKRVVGEEKYQYYIDKKIVEIVPLEKIQGRSLDEKCCVIADETQNATKPQVLSLVTRFGEDLRFLALCGDPRQAIQKGENALDWITAFFSRNNISSVGITHFHEDDCVRSGLVREILQAFEKEGGFYTSL